MDATLACARAGVTTGEWAARAARGVRRVPGPHRCRRRPGGAAGAGRRNWPRSATAAHATAAEIGAGRLRLLVGKPGLDGHSNGAEQIAVRARDAGFEVIYQGIRLTPEQIVAAAVAEDVHCVGLSILSGGHAELVPDVLRRLRQAGAGDIPVVVGGIIPPADAQSLRAQGVAAVFTPRDFGITAIIGRIVGGDPAGPQAPALTGAGQRHDNRRVNMTTAATAPSTATGRCVRAVPAWPSRAAAPASWRRPRACPPTRCFWTWRTPARRWSRRAPGT